MHTAYCTSLLTRYRYATFNELEMCISTDFSAQYVHKASDTRMCEHPGRSNMDVFVVTHSPRVVSGERKVTTDIWRIFSEAKGSSLFHNQALDDIVKYYQGALPEKLRRVYVFSDGCRSQYKGKKNFVRVAQFPSRMRGVHLVHRFAASHHFKGPRDAYVARTQKCFAALPSATRRCAWRQHMTSTTSAPPSCLRRAEAA